MSNRKMSKYLSRKIKFITVFPMIAVIFVNSYNFKDHFLQPTTRISEGFNAAAMFEYFFSNELLRFAVPMFFAISGFLFFFTYENTAKCYVKKLKSRAKSILIPYLIWTTLSGLTVTILSQIPFFASLPIIEEKAFGWTSFYMYLISPAAFQLWFLQQLMIFVLLAPILYFLIKKTRGIILIALAIPWLMDYSFSIGIDGVFSFTIINFEGLFTFSVGAAFAIFSRSREFTRSENRIQTMIYIVIWILLSLLNTYIAAFADDSFIFDIIMLVLYKLNEAVGVIAMWYLFDHIAKRIYDKKGFIIAATHLFIVYAMHEPMLHIFFQMALRQGSTLLGHVALYICLPLSVGAVCIIVSMALRKNCRKFHGVLTGGR
ncbi:MAG: acyltransferase [Ruminococcus sp.]|nr:acyltransferase [Ruminococcus sp.]